MGLLVAGMLARTRGKLSVAAVVQASPASICGGGSIMLSAWLQMEVGMVWLGQKVIQALVLLVLLPPPACALALAPALALAFLDCVAGGLEVLLQ